MPSKPPSDKDPTSPAPSESLTQEFGRVVHRIHASISRRFRAKDIENLPAHGDSTTGIDSVQGADFTLLVPRPEPEESWIGKEGTVFGDYRLVKPLGRGGFAQVWQVTRESDGRQLALKVLSGYHAASEDAKERFRREGRLAASVDSDRVVHVVSAEILDGRPGIIMELMPGGTLLDLIDAGGPLDTQTAVDAILDVIEGLEAAHRLGIVHRDVKPSNCFIDSFGRVKIGDFGISRSLSFDKKLTATGGFLGTPAYATPEQLQGKPVDHRTDLYAVGVTLYELLAGQLPFEATNPAELVANVLKEQPKSFSECGVAVSPSLEKVIFRLLAKDPEARFQNSEQLRTRLLEFSSRRRPAASLLRRSISLPIDGLFVLLLAIMTDEFFRDAFLLILFPLSEWIWKKTPGKAIFRIVIKDIHGGQPSGFQILIRNLVFWGPPLLIDLFLDGLPEDLAALWFLALFVTVRRVDRPGLHDLLSKTRVRKTGELETVTVYSPLPAQSSTDSDTEKQGETLGPYKIIEPSWTTETASLFVGHDEDLGRKVWIRIQPQSLHPANPFEDRNRGGRLRWIRGGLDKDSHWDAFEVPSGNSLMKIIGSGGQFSWSETIVILQQLAEEIRLTLDEEENPDPVSVSRVWLDSHGVVKLLDFPPPESVNPVFAHTISLRSQWPHFLREIAFLALAGESGENLAPNQDHPTSASIPVRGMKLLRRLSRESAPSDSLDDVIAEIKRAGEGPEIISHGRRNWHLLLVWLVPAFISLAGFNYFRLQTHLDPSRLIMESLALFLLPFAAWSTLGIVFSFVFRGGHVLWFLGGAVVVTDGSRASRLRCSWRAVLAWIPLAPVVASGVVGAVWREQSDFPAAFVWEGYRLVDQYTFAGMGAGILVIQTSVLLMAAALVIIHPSRGVHDRLAGTLLVPR